MFLLGQPYSPVRIAKGVEHADGLAATLDSLIDDQPGLDRTTVTLKVVDLASDRVLYDREGKVLLTPASVLKIYTTACALDVLGPDQRFPTRVESRGRIEEQTLHGNLRLVGGGDAMLNSTELRTLADRVVDEFGLRRIQGLVVVDNSRYASPLKGPGWMWDDDPRYYNMSITPLMVDFNVLRVNLRAVGDEIRAELDPPASYPPLRSVSDREIEGKRVWRAPFTHPLLVNADQSLGEPNQRRVEQLTMHDPAAWIAALFKKMIEERGVSFAAMRPQDGANQISMKGEPSIVELPGATLGAALYHLNKKSENAVGEVVLHEIAVASGAETPDWESGAQAVTRWLVDRVGLAPDSFRIRDGSGLSRYNLISADSAVKLLAFMHRHDQFDVFYETLPNYALTDGDADHVEQIVAKPGGMSAVSTIAGYIRGRDDRLLAFALLANGLHGTNAPVRELRQRVWQTLLKY
ncbi:MAG: D-alanyl-D-alanine carboxypeptidase/D-alanyl-D-alanine-endopeptidase [Planctomycetota bacterium]